MADKKRTVARKRRNGAGGKAYQVRPELWRVDLSLGYDENGKRKRRPVWGATADEAERKARDLLTDHGRGLIAAPESITVAAYANRWLARLTTSERTRDLYQQELAYALTHIGRLRVQAVQPHHIKDALAAIATYKVKEGPKKGSTMSPRTQGKVLTRLRSLFREAVVDRIIYASPAEGIRRARTPAPEAVGRVLDQVEAARLVRVGKALEDAGLCRLWPALYLCLRLGLRRGEVMGLAWEDIDFENGVIHVRHAVTTKKGPAKRGPLKTVTARRDVFMPQAVVQVLKAHCAKQTFEKEAAREAWDDSGAVFATELGALLQPDSLNRALENVLEWTKPETITPSSLKRVPVPARGQLVAAVGSGKALPTLRVHDLRHTYATLALRERVPIDVVSRNLGHARISITWDIYRHVLDSERREANVEIFDDPYVTRNEAALVSA